MFLRIRIDLCFSQVHSVVLDVAFTKHLTGRDYSNNFFLFDLCRVAKIVPSVDNAESAVGNDWTDLEGEEADLPVQGPLPYEPEDAPWRRSKKSGIRKLYINRLFTLLLLSSCVQLLFPLLKHEPLGYWAIT